MICQCVKAGWKSKNKKKNRHGVLVKRNADEDDWEEPKRDTDDVDREELEWNLSCCNKIPCK